MKQLNKIFNTETVAAIAVLATGMLVAVLQYLENREIMLDESWLALNIFERSYWGLLKPLEYGQAAPVLFLMAEKFFSCLIPNSEFGLRLFPLLCFLGSFILYYKTIKLFSPERLFILIPISFFAFNEMLQFYGPVQAKQYICDVMVLLAIYYFSIAAFRKERPDCVLLAVVGAIAIFLSNIAPVALFSVGAYISLKTWRSGYLKSRFRHLVSLFAVWLTFFAAYYFLFIRNHPTNDYMVNFWRHAFLPYNSVSNASHFIYINTINTLNSFFPYSLPDFPKLTILLLGLVVLLKARRFGVLILLLMPVALHLVMSALKLYPFDQRFLLYCYPCFIVLISVGVYFPAKFVWVLISKNMMPIRIFCLCIPLCLAAYFYSNYPTPAKLQIKEALQYIDNHIEDDERAYIHFFFIGRYRFYQQSGILPNLPPEKVIEGLYINHDEWKYGDSSEIDTLTGRNWLLLEWLPNGNKVALELDSLGFTKLEEIEKPGCYIDHYLFEPETGRDHAKDIQDR